MGEYNITEGQDSLKRVLLMMNYDMGKTLSENISEQPESVMDRRLGITSKNAKALGMSEKDYEKALNKSMYGEPIDWSKYTWSDIGHTLIDIAAVGALFIPLVGPFISVGLELANAGWYMAEGDEYMAGFSLAFAIIPGGKLFTKIPAVKKLGRDGLAKLLKKSASKSGKLTKLEKEAIEQLTKNSKWLKLNTRIEVTKMALITKLNRKPIKSIVRGVYDFYKKHPKKLNFMGAGIELGGILYTYPKLAKIYGWEPKTDEDGNLPTEDEIPSMLPSEKSSEEVAKSLGVSLGLKMDTDDPDYEPKESEVKSYEELLSTISSTDVSKTKSTNKNVKSKPTTFQDLLDGRKTIRKGQKGDVVRDIQRMLVSLGFKLGDTGPKGDGVDGDFGNKTKLAVENFQDDNDLKEIDGIVGKETSTKLKQLYDEK